MAVGEGGGQRRDKEGSFFYIFQSIGLFVKGKTLVGLKL